MDRRVIKTRTAIQKAYFHLIVEKQTTKITITEIAKRADIDRKTFYLHYNTQIDIIKDFCKVKIESVFEELQDSGFFAEPFDTFQVFSALNHMFQTDIEFYRALAKNSIYDIFWDEIKMNIVKHSVPIYLKKVNLPELNMNLTIDYTISGIISMYRRWLVQDIDMSLEDMSSTVNEVVVYGLQKLLIDNK